MCLPWHHDALRWDTVALLPVLLLVWCKLRGLYWVRGRDREPSNGTGTGRKGCGAKQHGKGEWLGKTMIKKWSNNGGFEKKMGVSGWKKCCHVSWWTFFIPVDISRNHGTKAYFWWCFRNQWHALHLEPSADPRKYQLTGRSSTDPAREPSLFGQCHKSWLRSAMSLSEWTVGEWFLADRKSLLAKSFP